MGKHDELRRKVAKKAIARGISTTGKGGYERHVLMCLGKSCCEGEDCREVGKRLNKQLGRLRKNGRDVYCSFVECLRLCRGGPLMVVYPDGVWYHSVTADVVDRIVEGHLVGGKVVQEYAFACNPMNETTPARGAASPKPEDSGEAVVIDRLQ